MSELLNQPPIYDAIVKKDDSGRYVLTEAWRPWLVNIKEWGDSYLSPVGILIPPLTTAQRDSLSTPPDGLMIRVSDALLPNQPQIRVNGAWYNFDLTLAP